MWRLSDGQVLRCRQWQDECVLYNDWTGNTHLLDPAALFLLRALQGAPSDTDTLAGLLRSGCPDDALSEQELAELLAELCELQLIEAH